MPKWQPPHPDPNRTPTPRRQLPRRPGPQPAPVHTHDQCAWQGCERERTVMTSTPMWAIGTMAITERFGLCDYHISLTVGALKQNAKETKGRLDKGHPAQPGDIIPGRIYYARIGDLIKIGYSTNPYRRLAQYPPGTQLLALEPGTTKLERARHSLFHAHLSHGREWFNPNPELDAWIQQVIDKHGPPPFESPERRRPDEAKPVVGGKRSSRKW